jgi:hypothetical protein
MRISYEQDFKNQVLGFLLGVQCVSRINCLILRSFMRERSNVDVNKINMLHGRRESLLSSGIAVH